MSTTTPPPALPPTASPSSTQLSPLPKTHSLTRTLSDGKKCRVKAHGGVVNIEGTLTAKVNDKLQIQSIEVWFDPMSFFNEATKGGAEVIIEDGAVTPDADSAGKCPFAGSLAASGASAHL